ncbi:hypothetical protein HYC85_003494 [Camellia sinensis]|uniref:Calcineurin-like phosphoesterase domain-containing protein n=1 Tax=Camellia sinensis TaxID=4442 RepID=A0A7J7HUG6_CAMSI|nr:hypothetical protein HYC85_003494 [Camellia sinensis]
MLPLLDAATRRRLPCPTPLSTTERQMSDCEQEKEKKKGGGEILGGILRIICWYKTTSYGIHDIEGSAKRIYEATLGTPEGHLIIFLAHNGPTGLGSNVNDICGRYWVFGGGDHGDPGYHQPAQLKGGRLTETTKLSIPLVVFGHMHKELAYGNGIRKMMVVGADNTIYLNGAIVPRVKRLVADEQATNRKTLMNNETSVSTPNAIGTVRAFTLVEISDGKLKKIAEAWVSVIGDKTALEEERILYNRGRGTEISDVHWIIVLGEKDIIDLSVELYYNDDGGRSGGAEVAMKKEEVV